MPYIKIFIDKKPDFRMRIFLCPLLYFLVGVKTFNPGRGGRGEQIVPEQAILFF